MMPGEQSEPNDVSAATTTEPNPLAATEERKHEKMKPQNNQSAADNLTTPKIKGIDTHEE